MEFQGFQIQSYFRLGLFIFVFLLPSFSRGLEEYISAQYFKKHEILDDSKFNSFLKTDISPSSSQMLQPELNNKESKMLALHRNLIGEGSHRRLSSSIRLEIQVSAQSCQAIVIERLPSGVFADPFELQHLVQRKVFSNAAVFGDANLELPSFRSNRSLVEVHMRIDPSMFSGDHKQLEINIELPLHARYQPLGYGFSRVEFGLPDVVFSCRNEGNLHDKSCLLGLTDQGVKDEDGNIVWEVPCGNKEHEKIVSFVTFISAILSALLIVWTSVSSPNVAFTVDLKQS